MGLRRLYHLLMNSERKSKQSPQSENASASSQSKALATHSDYLVLGTSQLEITSPQNTDDSPPNQEPLPSGNSLGKQPEESETLLPEVRTDERRYGQIFHNPNVEAIGMPSSEETTPTKNPSESTKALFPPLPPFCLRKRGCGGA